MWMVLYPQLRLVRNRLFVSCYLYHYYYHAPCCFVGLYLLVDLVHDLYSDFGPGLPRPPMLML